MKKLFFLILVAGFQLCHSQECFTPDNQLPIQLNDGACNNFLLFIPNKCTPTLSVKLNFHFFRNDDGSGEYQPVDSLKIKQMIQWINQMYKYLVPPTIAPITLTDTIYDSKIQFVLKRYITIITASATTQTQIQTPMISIFITEQTRHQK